MNGIVYDTIQLVNYLLRLRLLPPPLYNDVLNNGVSAMLKLNWQDVFYHKVTPIPLKIGEMLVDEPESLDFGSPIGIVSVQTLQSAASEFMRMTVEEAPQLAFYVFGAVRRPRALDGYFPLVHTLDEDEQKSLYKLAQEIMVSPRFDVQVLEEHRGRLTARLPQVAYFVAAQIAEIFFYRRDILERLLAAKPHFWLYTSQEAFKNDGGAAGGSFNGEKGCIQLVMSRLFEGFNTPTPGVAPFLHEFGHMLDFLDAGQGKITRSSGFLPGMRESDGAIYEAEARELFLKGKRLELERYVRLVDGAPPADPLPIGHPYVFQNDTEFIAGYFEMFFRNPHTFAAQNPDLYQSFVLTFGQDTRKAWAQDFPFYIQQNRDFYLSGKKPNQPGLTV
jgi:hypothetical protein